MSTLVPRSISLGSIGFHVDMLKPFADNASTVNEE